MEVKTTKIGSQTLYELHDRLRFVINELLPATGARGQFSIRDKVIREAIKRGKRLEIVFKNHDFSVIHNPIDYLRLGEKREQVGYYPGKPMFMYWYKINWRGEID